MARVFTKHPTRRFGCNVIAARHRDANHDVFLSGIPLNSVRQAVSSTANGVQCSRCASRSTSLASRWGRRQEPRRYGRTMFIRRQVQQGGSAAEFAFPVFEVRSKIISRQEFPLPERVVSI